jgi:peptidoglycan hydrolase CwlO-like protein
MDMLPLLTVIGGVMLSIIGYFLKKTMDDLRSVKEMSYDNRSKIELLQNDYNNKYNNLSEKFDELKLTMNELIKEIKELNKRIK